MSAMGSKTQNKRRSKCSYHLGNYKGFRSSVPATGPEIQSLLSHSDLNKNNFGSMTVTKASLEHVKEGAREERPGWGCTANADHAFERFSKGEGEKWGKEGWNLAKMTVEQGFRSCYNAVLGVRLQ